jgi:excisionase family DNA binding protein
VRQDLEASGEEIPPAVIRLAKAFAAAMTPSSQSRPVLRAGEGPHPLLSIDEAARMLGVSRMTVDRAIKSGEFPSVQFRRTYKVPRAFVESLLQAAEAGRRVVVEEYAAAWQASVQPLTGPAEGVA